MAVPRFRLWLKRGYGAGARSADGGGRLIPIVCHSTQRRGDAKFAKHWNWIYCSQASLLGDFALKSEFLNLLVRGRNGVGRPSFAKTTADVSADTKADPPTRNYTQRNEG